MRSQLMVFTLTAVLIASLGVTPAFAQIEDPIAISTDKSSYSDGETIVVSGEVKELLSGYAISLQVIAPNGNLVTVQQLDVGADKMFTTELTAGGGLWRSSGTYTISVLYGTEARTAETTFEFGGSTGGPGPSGPSINVEGFNVGYSITGGSILNITPDVDANSLIIEISTTSDGELTITLPRALIDAVLENGDDDEFFVLVDAEEVDFDETKTSSDRTLTIAFPDGAEEIEIIGTFVIPEFGAIAALILAVAIISIIVVSAKTRLSLIPRY
ncbi:MAG: PEFG-CTERM sorting domain-containing protein [Nitrosopumilaceae archaeon]